MPGKAQPVSAQQQARADALLERVNLNAAGIDVGAEEHWVAVPEDRAAEPVQRFGNHTAELHRLANWLKACGVDTVGMESTGVYWIPLYEILEERKIEVVLANAQQVRNVPGRKTDVSDSRWLQILHTFGLLRGSFRPEAEIVALRTLVRHRSSLVQEAATRIQRMQKALVLMNVQLPTVVTDITGKTGIAILRDIAAGSPLYRMTGQVDLTGIPGIGPLAALTLISEIGTNMSKWPSAAHFASWAGLAPQNKISGGKRLSSKTQPSGNRAAHILRIAAMANARSDNALGAFYRRLAVRTGKAKAITATARKIAVIVYSMLNTGEPYREQGADNYNHQQRRRRLTRLRKQAQVLGYALVSNDSVPAVDVAVS